MKKKSHKKKIKIRFKSKDLLFRVALMKLKIKFLLATKK